jgi:hypothetical protein
MIETSIAGLIFIILSSLTIGLLIGYHLGKKMNPPIEIKITSN